SDRWPLIENLVAHGEDMQDHNLALMYWWAAEPCVAAEPDRGIALAKTSQIPIVREFIARRLCALATENAKGDIAKVNVDPLSSLAKLLGETDDKAFQK